VSEKSRPSLPREETIEARIGRHRTATRLRGLRDSTGRDRDDRLHLATLRIRIPNSLGLSHFSNTHPHLRIEVLNRNDVSRDLSVSDYWVSGAPPGVWANELRTYPDVVKVDSLAEVGDGCVYRVTYRNPGIIYLYRRLGLPIQFPLRIQGGHIQWEIVARDSEFANVLRYAREVDPGLQILSIRRRPLRSHLPLLTTTQHDLLIRAMAAGYFAVPRGISLTELARQLGRSKSSVSEAIALIEKKLLESALRPSTLLP
jgi:predicted DNA binding protein